MRPSLPKALAFEGDSEDHCETSAVAFQDVKPFLLYLCQQLRKEPSALRIYDPYFCAGSVVKHLGSLGFESVYNRCVRPRCCCSLCHTLPAHTPQPVNDTRH